MRAIRSVPDSVRHAAPPAAAPVSDPRRLRVLVIDGHALIRTGLLRVLERLPGTIEALGVAALAEALPWLGAAPADLVIVDDVAGGAPACAALAQHSPGAPVVFVLDHVDGGRARELLGSGARGCLAKRGAPELIAAALALVLAGGTYVPPEVLQPPRPPAGVPSGFTPRQFQVLNHLAAGQTNKEIAAALGTSESTIRAHVTAIFRALAVENRTQATHTAIARGLVGLGAPA